MTRKAGDAIIYWKSLLLLLRLLQDMTKLLRFFSALFAADHMLLLCEVVEMPVVVVVMIEFYFFFCQKGKGQKKERKTPRLSASLFLSFSHGAAAAITSSNNRPLHTPKTRVARRTSTRERQRHTANSYLLFLNNNWSLTNQLPNPLHRAN
jgi:hypothetical protein